MLAYGMPLKMKPVPSAAGTLIVTVGRTFGAPSKTCQFGADGETVVQNSARIMASPSWVVPLVNAAWLSIGDAFRLAAEPVTVTPPAITTFSGRISVGTVVVLEPADGLGPTIVWG